MKEFKPKKSIVILEIFVYLILSNIALFLISKFVDSYVEINLFKVLVGMFDVYCLYYILLIGSLKYYINEKGIVINSLFGLRKINIDFDTIDGYYTVSGAIKGFKLTGFGRFRYAFGRYVIENVGVTHMFATASSELVYIHTNSMSYALSPIEASEFINELKENGKEFKTFKINKNKHTEIYKDKKVFIPFILVTIIIIVMILVPFLLYLSNKLPVQMPLSFDSNFYPLVQGTGKNFAFKQMSYGVLNMIILVCMYYASYFHAKYDKKSAYKYIYISLAIALTFLILQIRILTNFM